MTTPPFVLVLLSAARQLYLNDGTEVVTGFWAEELVVPCQILRKAGWRLQIATPGGVTPQVDADSLDPATFGGNREKVSTLKTAIEQMTHLRTPIDLDTLSTASLEALLGVFIPGGNGPLVDLCQAASVDRLLRHCRSTGKPVATLCHGAAALLATSGGAERSPFIGQRVTCFSAAEESATALAGRWPYTLEERLRQVGFQVRVAAPWQSHIISDDLLLSGQNPASATALSHAFVQRLSSLGAHRGKPHEC